MFFDLDPWGKYLATGSQDGSVLIYDTSSFELLEVLIFKM
jgi:WD40 repeat protein